MTDLGELRAAVKAADANIPAANAAIDAALRKAKATGLRIAAGICDAGDASPVLAATMKALADSIERGEA